MEDQACPKCKTTLYRNPNMKLMVNVCGHNLCESCVELLFVKGSGSCPECGIALRRNNFRLQLFEDSQIDKEVDIRKRVLKDFSKKEEDFNSLAEYNDYLEMIEDIIFNLSNNVDIVETNQRIADYKEKNKDWISKNRHKKSKEQEELSDMLAQEAKEQARRHKEVMLEALREKELKEKSKEKLIDDLMFSDSDANAIVEQHKSEQQSKRAKFSTGLDVGSNAVSSFETPFVASVPYRYERPTTDLEGPGLPQSMSDYYKFVRKSEDSEKASGFRESIPCVRALQEAMCGLFYAYK